MPDPTHTEWTDRLSPYLDDELPRAEREAVEAHVAGCPACRAVLEDLRRIVAVSLAYEGAPPERDLWPGIARAIDRRREVRLPVGRPALRFSIGQVAAAAILFTALGGSAVWLSLRSRLQSPEPPVVATAPPVAGGATALPARATEAYDRAVADLELILAEGRGRLDTTTVRVLEQNLALIDRAIAEAQAAILADPANAYLQGRVAAHMRRKLDILRRAASALTA